MSEMKAVFQGVKKTLEAYADRNPENGYSLIVWDGKNVNEKARGKMKEALKMRAWILGRCIGEGLKDDRLSLDVLGGVIKKVNEGILAGAIEAIEERAGADWLKKETEAMLRKHAIGKAEDALAELIWKEESHE